MAGQVFSEDAVASIFLLNHWWVVNSLQGTCSIFLQLKEEKQVRQPFTNPYLTPWIHHHPLLHFSPPRASPFSSFVLFCFHSASLARLCFAFVSTTSVTFHLGELLSAGSFEYRAASLSTKGGRRLLPTNVFTTYVADEAARTLLHMLSHIP